MWFISNPFITGVTLLQGAGAVLYVLRGQMLMGVLFGLYALTNVVLLKMGSIT